MIPSTLRDRLAWWLRRCTTTRPQSVKSTRFRSFLNRVDIKDVAECWPWTGYIMPKTGYGALMTTGQKLLLAHRLSFQYYYQPPEMPSQVRHTCDNPPCVNPHHLQAGDARSNVWDSVLRDHNANRLKSHCKRGHLLDRENTYVNPNSNSRQCRTCQREAQRRYDAKRRKTVEDRSPSRRSAPQ